MNNDKLLEYLEIISNPIRFKFITTALNKGFFTTDLSEFEDAPSAWFHLYTLRRCGLLISDDEEGSGPVRISWQVNEGLLHEILSALGEALSF